MGRIRITDKKPIKSILRMYVKLGTHLLECEYGIERTNVSDFFKNSNLKGSDLKWRFQKIS